MAVEKLGQAPEESIEPVVSGLAIGGGVAVRVRRCLCLPYLFHMGMGLVGVAIGV